MRTQHLLVAALLALPAAARASTSVGPVLNGPAGSYAPATVAPNLLHIGAPVYRVEVSTPVDTPVLLVTGAGQLYSIHCGSGTSSGYELTYDSATSSGITVATVGKALHAPVYSPGQTQAAPSSGLLDLNNAPAQFANGLVAITHGNVINCYIEARLNTGANPGP